MEKTKVLELCKKEKIRFIHLQFSDLDGIVKSVEIPISQLADTLAKGKWFDGSSVEGFARIAESDMFLQPDLSTFAIIPWDSEEDIRAARIICDVMTPDKTPFMGDPRQILKKNLAEVKKLGFEYFVGPELEFFLFNKGENGAVDLSPTDSAGYFDSSDDWASVVRKEISNAAEAMGIEIETVHHEVSTSQHEIDFKYANASQAADNVITLKFIIKAIADRYGLHATFMPKPVFGINGSGMHVHQSLWKGGKNAFFSSSDKYFLSTLAKQFIAGQLKEAPGICAVTSPLVNSYKRLVPGYEAPVYLSWARVNRSALIRIPRFSADNQSAARIELRCPDPSCNPYLAFSAMLLAGMSGIKDKLDPPKPIEENIYEMNDNQRKLRKIKTLPDSLGSAIAVYEKSKLAEAALGQHIFDRLRESRRREWNEYRIRISSWEEETYLKKF